MITYPEEITRELTALFKTHADARHRELWWMTWTVIGACAARDIALERATDLIDELKTANRQQDRVIEILYKGCAGIYGAAVTRRVDSNQVKQMIDAIDQKLMAARPC